MLGKVCAFGRNAQINRVLTACPPDRRQTDLSKNGKLLRLKHAQADGIKFSHRNHGNSKGVPENMESFVGDKAVECMPEYGMLRY